MVDLVEQPSGAPKAGHLNPSHQRIWQVVAAIPRGRVASYGRIAQRAGLPGRARLAGTALRLTPEALALPWHRVVRASGSLAFSPDHPNHAEQTRRLRDEGVPVVRGRVDIAAYGWADDDAWSLLLPASD